MGFSIDVDKMLGSTQEGRSRSLIVVLLHKKEFKGKMNGWRAWESSYLILVLFHKKEFKGKANSKKNSAKLIEVEVHTQWGI